MAGAAVFVILLDLVLPQRSKGLLPYFAFAALAGQYLRSHSIQALAIEMAEALAEWVHAKIRHHWGLPDPPETTPEDLFRSKYRGKRYSFGYPACKVF